MRQPSNTFLAQKIGRYVAIGIVTLLTGLAVNAQPPVTAGLNLRLEAATGFSANGTLPATWTDLSTGGNNMIAASDAQEPFFETLVPGLGIPGIRFVSGAGQYMQNVLLNSTFSNKEATLFVVRRANTAGSITPAAFTMLSISDDANFHDEFCMVSDIAMHHYSSGNFQYRNHPCFPSLPDDQPVVLSGVFGRALSDVEYYVNNIKSTNALSPAYGAPLPYSVLDRRIYVGTRFWSGRSQQYFDGYIFEILAYNRKLSPAEISSVNDYLRCKYNVVYPSCNTKRNEQCIAGNKESWESWEAYDDLKQKRYNQEAQNTTGITDPAYSGKTNELFQNMPNPFSGPTSIAYRVVNMQNTAGLQITDFAGRKVAYFSVLLNGSGQINFDVTNMAAGIYLCSLIVDGQVIDHKKMIVKP